MSPEKNRNYWILIAFAIITIIISSCSKEEGSDEPYIPVDEISSAETDLIPDKETKTVSTLLQFKNLDNIDYLVINKSGG
ncbi:MAG TPA: hypothetical protein VKZ56_08840, partial [Membranihabitans sp.]|nr:hypothetical protein [Membranihabitans sp.]